MTAGMSLSHVVCRDHCPRTRLQQEAGGAVVRSVFGAAAVPPGGHRGLFRSHQEEGGRNGKRAGAPQHLRQAAICFTCVFCVQLEVFQVNVAPDLQQQLVAVVQELGVHIPPPVSDSN